MKKILYFFAGAFVAVLVLGVAGLAYAQWQTPPAPESPDYYGRGMMFPGGGWGSRGYRGHGMMGGFLQQSDYDTHGPVHDYMITAMAKAFDMTPEELENLHDSGVSLWRVAEEKGMTPEEFRDLMVEARTEAINLAVESGIFTQDQANWMIDRMSNMWSGEYGPGFGGCIGAGPRGFGRFGRGNWNGQP